MDFRTLQYFSVVARELNFTRAAEKLNMSQPPLSSQIKSLENDLGVQLFIRGKRRMQLTEAGHLLLRRATQILDLAEKTRQDLRSLDNELSGTICIGMVEGMAPHLASRWIARFREEYPMVSFRLFNGSGDDVTARLIRGLSDVAVIARPYDTEAIDGIPVGREPWCAFMSPDHPLAKTDDAAIPLSALRDVPLVVPNRRSRIEAIRRWFDGIGAEPEIVAETANYIDAVTMAEHKVGVSIYPMTKADPGPNVVRKMITGPARTAEYDLAWSRSGRPTLLVSEFINFVRDFMEEYPAVGFNEEIIPDDAEIL